MEEEDCSRINIPRLINRKVFRNMLGRITHYALSLLTSVVATEGGSGG